MAASMETIEIKLIPMAVLKALLISIPLRTNKMVSSNILVIRPLMIANTRMKTALALIFEN